MLADDSIFKSVYPSVAIWVSIVIVYILKDLEDMECLSLFFKYISFEKLWMRERSERGR